MRHASQHAIKAYGSILCILIFFLAVARAQLWPLRLGLCLSLWPLLCALVVSLASADCSLPLRDAGAGASPARLCRAFSDFERALLFHARVFTILEALERIDAEQPKAEAQHGGREAAEGEP